jgi:hypothetical protein
MVSDYSAASDERKGLRYVIALILTTSRAPGEYDHMRMMVVRDWYLSLQRSEEVVFGFIDRTGAWIGPFSCNEASLRARERKCRVILRHKRNIASDPWLYLNLGFVPLLQPNMKLKQQQDPVKASAKLDRAVRDGELTLLWNVGLAHRERANRRGVYSFRDPRCTASLLGIPDPDIRSAVDNIIRVNRDNGPTVIHGDTLRDIMPIPLTRAVYVDLETIPELGQRVYMIGAGEWGCTAPGVYTYRAFLAKGLDHVHEQEVIHEFFTWLDGLGKKDVVVYYWFAEKEFLEGKTPRGVKLDMWTDLYDIAWRGGLAIRGCYTYRLKEVASALFALRCVDTVLPEGNCRSGLESVETAKRYYKHRQEQDLRSLMGYNAFDCRILHDLVMFLTDKLKKHG